MKGFTKKSLKNLFSVLMATVMVALLGLVSMPMLNAKADEATYSFNAKEAFGGVNQNGTDDTVPKNEILPAGSFGTNDYFTIVNVDESDDSTPGFCKRANSNNYSIEIPKKGNGSITFTVSEGTTAELVIDLSSNGSSSQSYFILEHESGERMVAVGEKLGYLIVTGSDYTSYKFSGLKAGQYTMYSNGDDKNINKRGVRVFNIAVTETPADEVKERADWSTVVAPSVTELKQLDSSGKIRVIVAANLGFDGGDKLTVSLYKEDGTLIASDSSVAESTETVKDFSAPDSGKYYAVAVLERDGVDAKTSEKSALFDYLLPIGVPGVGAVTNNGNGSVIVSWDAVKEATNYTVLYKLATATEYTVAGDTALNFLEVKGLSCDVEYDFIVKAGRGDDIKTSSSLRKMIRNRVDRNWAFTYFGSSTGAAKNMIKDLNEDAFTFKLISCTYNADGTINEKGGKFTAYFDGISYYYTKINAAKENFVLTATFTVDYINPVPDGQEGFGLVIRDSLGEYGVASSNFETNSVSLIATKFETTSDGTKYSMKDGLGVRFSYGLTPANIADGTMSTVGINKTFPCQLENGNLIHQGDVYTLTVKKTNTGYHCIYTNQEGETMEQILYGTDKLLKIDKENVYVGFAVARGCNVSVSNVSFTVTDTATDPPAEPEPAPSFGVNVAIVSPETAGSQKYKLRFRVNCDGSAYISDALGKKLTDSIEVKADVIAEIELDADFGTNSYTINFTAKDGYTNALGEVPKTAIASNKINVVVKKYDQPILYVSPNAEATGQGTLEDPISLRAALAYVIPGQKIILLDGVYELDYQLKISKGNSGTEDAFKYLVAAEGTRPVLDFSKSTSSSSGFVCWGDWWYMEGFDITGSADNIKGFQLAGNHNIINRVNTYKNGDTGLQISGSSNDPKAEWPTYNLVINCTSHDNMDSAMNNADGFAAKLTVGEGNRFEGCIAYNNIDDGWDLYAKVESGAIGVVTIENCIAYENGFLKDKNGKGDGNGFKLGGEGIAVAHVIKNSIAFGNRETGFTSNSNPAIQIYSCTSYGNGTGFALYGKGSDPRKFVIEGALSLGNKTGDSVDEVQYTSATNYFQNGKKAVNSEGKEFTADIFANTDITTNYPTRDEKGGIVLNDLLVIKSDAGTPVGLGATLAKAETEAPEVPEPSATPTPEPTATPVPTESPAEPTAAPTEGADATPTVPPTGADDPDDFKNDKGVSPVPFIIIGVVLVAAAVAGGVVFFLKKKGKKNS